MATLTEINPGSWLGIFGGGQLGRMFTHAAQAWGYHVAVLETEPNCPASQAADRHLCPTEGQGQVLELVETLARSVQAVTLEFENVPSHWLRSAAQFTLTRPGAEFLEICQHRVKEKTALQAAGFPVTPFVPLRHQDDALAAGDKLGWPLVLKTSRSGYDGKGQAVVHGPAELPAAWSMLKTDDAIAEQRIEFVAEVSMLGARNARGEVITYPLVENAHAHHILDISRCPVSPELMRYQSEAREIVAGVAQRFEVEGIFCVEFFIDARKGLMVNEIAPRPHNSGHLTIEAFATSQFEQQLRATCNLPLGSTTEFRPAAMVNLLGDLWFAGQGAPQWEPIFRTPGAHLHLYGKAEPRPGRKMGHLTCTADTAEEAAHRASTLRAELLAGKL